MRDAKFPEQWGEQSKVAWKVPLPGRGWSQPITAKGKIFVTTAVSEKEEKPRRGERGVVPDALDPQKHDYRWKLLCLDADTGAILWDQTAYEGKPRIKKHRSNTYASETPATDGEVVVAYFGMTGISCYDLDGNRLWTEDLGAFPMLAGWGTGSSPIIHGEMVFVQCDNEQSSFVVALDKRTGKERWRKVRDELSNWSTPYLWKNKVRTELVIAGGKKMRAYDPTTGDVLWEMAGAGRASATPVGNAELLFVDSGDRFLGSPGRLVAVRAGASGDISLKANETTGPSVAWTVPLNTYRNTSPLLERDCLYMLEQHQGIVRCFDAGTGKLHYQQRIPEATGCSASPWVAAGKIYCLDEIGRTFVFESGPEFKLLATNRLDEDMFWASPAFTGNRLILRSLEHLYCISDEPEVARRVESPAAAAPDPLAPLASFRAHAPTTSFLFFSRDGKQLISGGSDQLVQIWDMRTGVLERTFGEPGGAFKSGAFAPVRKVVVTGSSDHAVRIWDLDSGRLKKTLEGHADQVETIAVASDDKTIASGGFDRTFRLWDLETWKATFTSPPQELAITKVAFSPDGKLVATGSGNIFEWRRAGEVKLWNAVTGEELALLPGHAACVNTVVFSPDAKQLATGTAEGMLRIWDVETRTEQSATNAARGVRTIAFFADGKTLALGRWPGRIALFDVPARRFEAWYPEQQPREIMVDMVAISPDATLIASSGNDGMIHLWPVPESTRMGEHRLWKLPAAGSSTAADLVRKWKPVPGAGATANKTDSKE